MLVVVANWGIADGTLVSAGRSDQIEWLHAVRRGVIRAGFRRDGRYTPADRVDVVLAGDTFDLLTSTIWTNDLRPWHRGPRARSARERVLAAAAIRGGHLLSGLRRWARSGIAVPRANRHGRPVPGDEITVPVGVAVLAGDRDRWLEAAQPAATHHAIGLGAAWSGSLCGATVRHGQEFDPFTCGEGDAGGTDDRGPTLAESLIVDLVVPFAVRLRAAADRWPVSRRLVSELAAARPCQAAAAFRRWQPAAGTARDAVADAWKSAVETWWRSARRTRPTCGVEYDPIDAVATTLAAAAGPAGGDVSFDLPLALPAGDMPAGGMPTALGDGPLILGHPPAAAGDGPLVCLGTERPPSHRGAPPTVILTRHDGDVRQSWLRTDSATAIVALRGQIGDRTVGAA